MKVPEKIYLDKNNKTLLDILSVKDTERIEYTCTDAFVEKTCEFIRKGGNRGDAYIVTEFGEEVFDFVQLAEDFKNYVKGE